MLEFLREACGEQFLELIGFDSQHVRAEAAAEFDAIGNDVWHGATRQIGFDVKRAVAGHAEHDKGRVIAVAGIGAFAGIERDGAELQIGWPAVEPNDIAEIFLRPFAQLGVDRQALLFAIERRAAAFGAHAHERVEIFFLGPEDDGAGVQLGTVGVVERAGVLAGGSRCGPIRPASNKLLGTPTPTATPTPTPTRSATRTPTPLPTTGQTTPTAVPSSLYPSTGYTAMPAPATPSPLILARFPGAVFPVAGTYTYTDTFGAYRADMPSRSHEGDDIFASYGTPVVAVQDGTITGMSTTTIGGNNIHLTTSRADYFYYAHLSRFATGLVVGAHVVAGQTIGYVGDTGDARGTPPHLHFEIHPDGGPAVDPTPYLDAWRAAGHLVTTSGSGQTTATAAPAATAADPAIAAALQQAADGFVALQQGVTSGSRNVPRGGGGLGLAGATLLVANTAGALLIKRLHVGAVLLP